MKTLRIWHLALQGCLKKGDIQYGCCPDTGGHIKYLLDLVDALQKEKTPVEQVIITRHFTDSHRGEEFSKAHEVLENGVSIVRIPDGNPQYLPKEELWTQRSSFVENLLSYLQKVDVRPDLIHAHYADAGAIAATLKEKVGIPYLYSAHSLGRVKAQLSAQADLIAFSLAQRVAAEELSLKEASCVIASSESEANEQLSLYQNYDPGRIKIIPPGTSFRPSPQLPARIETLRSQLAEDFEAPHLPLILAIARPVRRKNLSRLLQAYADSDWLQQHANLLILAGCRDQIEALPPEQQEELRLLFDLVETHDLSTSVSLPARHEELDLEAYYRLAAESKGVFVNPALHEPFGLTILEAALCGLPTIATKRGGTRNTIAEHGHGLLIDPHSTRELTEALETLLRSPEVYDKHQKAAVLAKPFLDWKFHAKRYLELLGTILEHRGTLPLSKTCSDIICCDIDNTLTGDVQALARLVRWFEAHPEKLFVVSTGRHLEDALCVLKKWNVPKPKTLITSVGSEVYHLSPDGTYRRDADWTEQFSSHWQRKEIKAVLHKIPGLLAQKPTLQRPFKLGYLIRSNAAQTLNELRETLARENLRCELIFSHETYLDVLPPFVNKGYALEFLRNRLGLARGRTTAAGDSMNDQSMLATAGKAIIVKNGFDALKELSSLKHVYCAQSKYAAGVLEGLETIFDPSSLNK